MLGIQVQRKNGMAKKADQFVKQSMAKIPGLSQKLPTRQTIWGEDKKRSNSLVRRILETAVLPWNQEKVIEDATNEELLSVFHETGEHVLPTIPDKKLTIDGEEYTATSEEYNTMKKQFGKTSKQLLDDLMSSKNYSNLTPEQKVKTIEDVYSYAKEQLKSDYAGKNGLKLKNSALYNTIDGLKDKNADISSYLSFKSEVSEIKKDSDKLKSLRNIETDSKTKSIIYEETFDGTSDDKKGEYAELKDYYGNENIINQYLDYKVKSNDKLKALRATGEKKKTEGLSDKEKVQLLKDSNYTTEQTEALYVNTIASDSSKKIYKYLKQLNGGNCIDDYMTYLTSDISADKTDNGLKSGKTVTGSASKKKGEAISKANMNKLAKIYLYATSNAVTTKTRSEDYYKLANYVHSLPDKEQKEILSTISSAKETTDGSYYWK